MSRKEHKPGRLFVTAAWTGCLAVAMLTWWSFVESAAAPDGKLLMSNDFTDVHPRISEIKPHERLVAGEDGKTERRLVSSTPAYVDVKVPAGYEEVTARFVVSGKPPIVEIGAMTRAGGEFLMRTGLNRNLDDLDWQVLSNGGVRLYQRSATYGNIDEFYLNPPGPESLATYGDPELPDTGIYGYQPQSGRQELHLSLRGRHRFRVYLDGESLDFKLDLQDMNRARGEDPVRVAVYDDQGHGPLFETSVADDGNGSDDQSASDIRHLEVTWVPPVSGFYLVDVATSDDVFIRRIFTSQRQLGFVGRVHLGDQIGYWDQPNPVKVRLAGSSLAVKTPTVSGRQTLGIGRGRMHVWEPMHLYEWVVAGGAEFTANERPLIIYTDGEIGLTSLVRPNGRFRGVTARQTAAQTQVDGLSFVLADYEPPVKTGEDTYLIEASFSVSDLARTPDDAFRFLLWAPMQMEWGNLEIKEAAFAWSRPPLESMTDWWGQFSRDAIEGSYPQDDIPSPSGRIFDEYVP